MGRSIAGKAPVGNSGRDRNGRIRPNTTPLKSRTSDRQREASRVAARGQTNRGQQVNQLRPGAMHTQWGAPGQLDGKTAGQDHILQFATAAGVCAALLLLAAAGLMANATERRGASTLATWMYVKTVTTAVTSVSACALRGYWVWSNYNGSSKLTSYGVLVFADWLFGLVVLVVLLAHYMDNGFWWLGFVVLLVFSAASLRTLSDLVYASLRKNKEKKQKAIDEKDKEKGGQGGEGGENPEDVESPTVDAMVVGTAVSDEMRAPSAPPLQHASAFTNIQEIPSAPASPVKNDRMLIQNPPLHPVDEYVNGHVMDQRVFEEKWLKLPQLSSRNDTFFPPCPALGDIKLHLKERQFDVVASGALEGVTRVYMHRRVSKGYYLLAEIVMSVGHDASAQCTLTTTLKVDEQVMGDPSLGRVVDSMDLGILFRF